MSRGRVARWRLEEIGQPYRTVVPDYGTTMKAPACLAVNARGASSMIRRGAIMTEGAPAREG